MPIPIKPTMKIKKFVYLVTDRNRSCIHVGMSTDLMKTIVFGVIRLA